jgi:putative transposase
MLSDKDFEELCLNLSLAREAREYAERMLKGDPQRLVRSRRGNVSGRYPSQKMGYTLQFESHTCELAYLLDLEHFQPDALAWVDQPDSFKLPIKDKNNRNITVTHTPDLFVVNRTHFEFVECKTEEELIKLSHKYPDRYLLGKDSLWRCPPGETYAAQFSFKYRVVSTAEIDRVQIRNALFLEDYLGEDTPKVAEETSRKLASFVAEQQRLKLSDLLDRAFEDGATADDVYTMIATGVLYVDLRLEPLVERKRVWVYPDQEAARDYAIENALGDFPRAKFIEVKEGARIIWNNRVLGIVHVGETKLYFEGEEGAAPAITYSHFEELIKRGEIQGIRGDPDSDPDQQWKALLNKANKKRKAEALRRERILKCHLAGEPLPEKASKRSLARWKASYILNERLYGNGLIGLLPEWHLRGDRKTQKLDPFARSIMMGLIESDYETLMSKGMFVVWGRVVIKCKEHKPSVKHPSYVTFIRYVKKRPEHLQALKRKGHRAAYASQPFY